MRNLVLDCNLLWYKVFSDTLFGIYLQIYLFVKGNKGNKQNFKADTFKRLSPMSLFQPFYSIKDSKIFLFTQPWWPLILFSVPWPLRFEIHLDRRMLRCNYRENQVFMSRTLSRVFDYFIIWNCFLFQKNCEIDTKLHPLTQTGGGTNCQSYKVKVIFEFVLKDWHWLTFSECWILKS